MPSVGQGAGEAKFFAELLKGNATTPGHSISYFIRHRPKLGDLPYPGNCRIFAPKGKKRKAFPIWHINYGVPNGSKYRIKIFKNNFGLL